MNTLAAYAPQTELPPQMLSTIAQLCGNFGNSPRSVPESRDCDDLPCVVNLIDDPIRTVNELTQRLDLELWHHTADLREILERARMRDKFVAEPRRRYGIIARDVFDDLRKISLSRSRQDYLEAHLSIFFSTSSSGTTSPRLISSNPCRTPAMNSMRSRISSKVDSSGSF